MKFAIDASNLDKSKTGIDFMTDGIIQGFRSFPEHELLVYTTDRYAGDMPSNWIKIRRPDGIASGLRWYWAITRDMRRRGVDCFISSLTFTAAAMYPRVLQIVPDLSPMLWPATTTLKHRVMFRITLQVAIWRAWKLVAISQSVADEIRRAFPAFKREIGVIPLSINDWALLPQSDPRQISEVVTKYNLPDKFVLSVSTIQPRKNYVNMIKAFAEFHKSHPDYKYVIVGKRGWKFDPVFQVINQLNLQDKVILLDYVPDIDMPAIHDAASLFMYMSVYEGFGIPPLNAAYRGIPLVVSDITVMREVMRDTNATFADPGDISAMTQAMNLALDTSASFANSAIISRYNWRQTAEALIKMANLDSIN